MFVTKQIAAKMPRTIVHSSSIWIWRNKASYQSICYPIELTLHEGNWGKERSYPRQKWERTEFPIWPLNSTWLAKSIHTYIHWHLFASVSTGVDRVIWLPLKHAVLSWSWESPCRKAFYSFWSFPLSSPTIPQKHTHTHPSGLCIHHEKPPFKYRAPHCISLMSTQHAQVSLWWYWIRGPFSQEATPFSVCQGNAFLCDSTDIPLVFPNSPTSSLTLKCFYCTRFQNMNRGEGQRRCWRESKNNSQTTRKGQPCSDACGDPGAAKGKGRAMALNSGCLAGWASSGGLLAAFRGYDTLSLELTAELGGHQQHS